MTDRVTLKGQVIAEIVAGNPDGILKCIEYGSFGEIKRIEWHVPESDDEGLTPIETQPILLGRGE